MACAGEDDASWPSLTADAIREDVEQLLAAKEEEFPQGCAFERPAGAEAFRRLAERRREIAAAAEALSKPHPAAEDAGNASSTGEPRDEGGAEATGGG